MWKNNIVLINKRRKRDRLQRELGVVEEEIRALEEEKRVFEEEEEG